MASLTTNWGNVQELARDIQMQEMIQWYRRSHLGAGFGLLAFAQSYGQSTKLTIAAYSAGAVK